MHALRVYMLICLLFVGCLKVSAGAPSTPVELGCTKPNEQIYVVKKPVSNVTLTNATALNTFTNAPKLYLPNRPHQSTDWVLLRDNVGRVINLVHLTGTGIIDLPHYNYANSHPGANARPINEFRNQDIGFVSALSAICIAGLVLGPVINCKEHRIHYKNNAYGTYKVILAMNNELDLIVRF